MTPDQELSHAILQMDLNHAIRHINAGDRRSGQAEYGPLVNR